MSNKTCGECKHHDKYSCLQLKDVVFIPTTQLECTHFCPKDPTNGDMIRQMNNEELRNFLISYRNDDCEKYCVRPCMFCDDRCDDATLAWLNSPAESERKDED